MEIALRVDNRDRVQEMRYRDNLERRRERIVGFPAPRHRLLRRRGSNPRERWSGDITSDDDVIEVELVTRFSYHFDDLL